jgi:hypothetical protein
MNSRPSCRSAGQFTPPHPNSPNLTGLNSTQRETQGSKLKSGTPAARLPIVLDLLFAEILKADIDLVAHLVADDALTQIPPGSARASSRAATLTPSPKMSCSSMIMSPRLMPMRNSMRRSPPMPPLRNADRALQFDRAAPPIDDTGEFDQHPVAGSLHDPAPVLGDLRLDQLPKTRLQTLVRPFLIRPINRE